MRLPLVLLALAFSPLAHAGSFYLEGPEATVKAEASEDAKEAESKGLDARVVRRMGVKSGWRYVVRVEGYADAKVATTNAAKLAEVVEGPVAVFSVDGDQAGLVTMVAPAGGAEPASPPPSTPNEASDAAPVLEAAVKAHKVSGLLLDGRDLRFAFRRTLPDGKVIDHVWARKADALYASVEPVEGDVVASRLRAIDEGAWLSVDGGAWEEQHVEKTRATLLDLGPASVLPFLLVLDPARQTRRELQRMELVGEGSMDGVPVSVLVFEGDRTAGPVKVELGNEDHLVRRVSFDNGELVYVYDDFGKLGGMHLPRHVITLRGGKPVDDVRITDLDLSPKLPDAWFAAP